MDITLPILFAGTSVRAMKIKTYLLHQKLEIMANQFCIFKIIL